MEAQLKYENKYYKAELGEFPIDWPEVIIDDLSSGQYPAIKAGPFGSSLTKDIYVQSGFKVYGQEQVIRGDLSYGHYFISEKKYRELRSCAVSEGDILLSLVGTAGKLLVIDSSAKAGVINPRLLRFRFNQSKISSSFFKYLFESELVQSHLETSAQGGTMAVLNAGMLKSLPIPLPSLQEQTAITNALSDVDSLLTELEKLVAKKQAIKTATMQQLLTGKTRLPQFATYTEGEKQGQPKGIKTSELGEIPEDWEVHSLSSLCDVRDGTHDSPKYKDNGIPLVTSKNIVDDILDLSNVSFISSEDAFEIDKRSKVDRGDIIMSMIGTVGSAVLVLEDPEFCIKNVALFKPKKVSGEFLVQLIRSKVFQDYLEDSMDGGIQKFVSLGTLRNMEVVLPCDAEQTAISTILSDMDNEIQTLEQRLTKTRQIKQGMMQQLLTGRTRLPFKRLETEQDGGS